jgi:hypothetical protein
MEVKICRRRHKNRKGDLYEKEFIWYCGSHGFNYVIMRDSPKGRHCLKERWRLTENG